MIRLCQRSTASRRLFNTGVLILMPRGNSLSYAAFKKLLMLKTNGPVHDGTVSVLQVNLLDSCRARTF